MGAVVRCVLESLALRYRWVLEALESLVGHRLEVIRVVGGGTQNRLLSQLTADACQLRRTASLEQSQNLVEWPLELTPQPASGNDQWELVLT